MTSGEQHKAVICIIGWPAYNCGLRQCLLTHCTSISLLVSVCGLSLTHVWICFWGKPDMWLNVCSTSQSVLHLILVPVQDLLPLLLTSVNHSFCPVICPGASDAFEPVRCSFHSFSPSTLHSQVCPTYRPRSPCLPHILLLLLAHSLPVLLQPHHPPLHCEAISTTTTASIQPSSDKSRQKLTSQFIIHCLFNTFSACQHSAVLLLTVAFSCTFFFYLFLLFIHPGRHLGPVRGLLCNG